jgi:pseudaminic acid synthase
MKDKIFVDGRPIGRGERAYIIAELSANHNQDYDQAVELITAARECGADAVKLQTYTADTITIDCRNKYFRIRGTPWDGQTLHDLYSTACTPWEWQPKLKRIANDLGLTLFSSPFDATAVDFLEAMRVPAHKIASFENVDFPLLRRVAGTGKPVVMSTGMATLAEIDEAVQTLRDAGCAELALLKCTSGYPATPEEMNLRTIPHLAEAFGVPVGLSDHTLGIAVPVAAVAIGACIIEKHFTLSRSVTGPDSAFSLEPDEFKAMVRAIRTAEKAVGTVHYGVSEEEAESRALRRSLFVVNDMKAGDSFTLANVRSIRPGNGLHTRYFEEVIGRTAGQDIPKGTPLAWDLIAGTRTHERNPEPEGYL